MTASLLIVEDHQALAVAIAANAQRCGLRTRLAPSLARARELLHKESFTGMLLDIGLPDGHGLQLVEQWEWPHKPEIAVITAHGEIENAIAARKMGIAHFFDKPIDFEELQAFFQALAVPASASEDTRTKPGNSPHFVGASPAMRPVFRQISHACASDQPVVIRGATGTGKTHVARLIQQTTGQANPAHTIHASSLLSENELVDAVVAAREKPLLIESVATLTPALQSHLVRTIDQLHDGSPRLIVTTGEEGLLEHVTDGRFNQELYYRLQILEVNLPPLKDRIDDIPAICACFLGELDPTTGSRIDDAILDTFANYDWPGNLRELRNVISYAVITSAGAPLITRQFIPEHLAGDPPQHARDDALSHAMKSWVDRKLEEDVSYKELSAELENQLLRILLSRFDGKPSHLAAALSINRSTLRKKLRNDGSSAC